jgi:signal transduction histidine kinase
MQMNSRPGTTERFAGLLVAAAARALSADAAALWMLDEPGTSLVFTAAYGLGPPASIGAPQDSAASSDRHIVPLSAIVLLREALSAGSASIEDASHDPRATDLPVGFVSGLCVSLREAEGPSGNSGGTSLGALCVYHAHPRRFSDSEVELVRSLAALGAASFRPVSPTEPAERIPEAQALAEVERARLARVTTHQLRSPITIAQSLLRNVVKGYAGPISDQQRDVLDRIAGQLDYLSHLVDDFLDLAASKSPPLTGQEGPVVLNPSAARAVLMLQPRAEEKGVMLTLHPCREELVVWASEESLDHILHNLVENAVKYTLPGGQVTVTLARCGEQSGEVSGIGAGDAQVTVADTGIGIPEEAQAHLFEEFYRAPNARAYNAVGTGLGLAIVRGLVDRYHGRITVRSASGLGTTFTVSFPLYRVAPSGPV